MEYSEVKNRVIKPFADFIRDVEVKKQNSRMIVTVYPNGFFYHQTKKLAESHLPLIDARLMLHKHLKHPEAIQDFNHETNNLIEIYNKKLNEPEYQNIYPDIDNIVNYLRKLISEKPKEKPYKSKARAYGIALALAYLDNKIDDATWEKLCERQRLAKNVLGIDTTGEEAAKFAAKIYPPGCIPREKEIERLKEDPDCKHDLPFGRELYKKWPD